MPCALKVSFALCAALAFIGVVWCSPLPMEEFQFTPPVGIWQTRERPTSTAGSGYRNGHRLRWSPSSGWATGPGKRSPGKVIEIPEGPETDKEGLIQLCDLLEQIFVELTVVSEEIKELNQVCDDFRGNISVETKETQ
ncbi:uncharacterized protein LOC129581288 [Paramacrobiotus metropolitanus]|uniref:uncharacterized protein LOC129581288 n=1 Tax=Paramacrobiotus metropolitanus TaxID=2943436 RepID=UPI0024460CFB|nr:uncharacterized protein LOC129581288 [Paramacrobiotus metropolitanus]